MRNECNIVQDILPLYLEGMVSRDSVSFVEEHLKNCPECSVKLDAMKKSIETDSVFEESARQRSEEALPLKSVKKKFRTRGIAAVVSAVIVTIVVMGIGLSLKSASIDYGNSEMYSQQDMDAAIKLITDEFYSWDGCKLYSISYTSDSLCQRELDYCNTLADEGVSYTECMVFRTHFRSPIFGGGGWNENTVYDWSWYLARTQNGEWELLTWGVP